MKRIRVEPISSYLERRRKGQIYVAVVANGFVYLSGLPPFDPETGDVKPAPFERQVEIVLEQMKHCLEAAGSSLAQVVKCNVYCTPDPSHFARFNEVYERYFGRISGAHFPACAVMAWTVRRRGRLRGGGGLRGDRQFSPSPRHIANLPPATLPRPAVMRSPRRRAPC